MSRAPILRPLPAPPPSLLPRRVLTDQPKQDPQSCSEHPVCGCRCTWPWASPFCSLVPADGQLYLVSVRGRDGLGSWAESWAPCLVDVTVTGAYCSQPMHSQYASSVCQVKLWNRCLHCHEHIISVPFQAKSSESQITRPLLGPVGRKQGEWLPPGMTYPAAPSLPQLWRWPGVGPKQVSL